MGLFKGWAKKTVETVKDAATEVTTEAAQEQANFWGKVATIGIFAIMAGTTIHHNVKPKASNDIPNFRTMTINNYYYRDPRPGKR